MKINYFYITDEVHGRPIAEIAFSDMKGLKNKFHPVMMSKNYPYSFIDILLEDPNPNIEENLEAKNLKELIDIPQDIIEEIITDQRPRADAYPDFYLILFKCLSVSHKPKDSLGNLLLAEIQIGIIIRENIIFTIHKEIPSLPVETLFRRFNKFPMKMAKGGITFFITTYIDVLIDQIYRVMEVWYNKIHEFEEIILKRPEETVLVDIQDLRRKLLDLVKILQADREILTNMLSIPKIFSKDDIPPELNDHISHMLDETDIMRNILTDITNSYYASVSANLNETMKRFTFLTSLFLLPSLIAGIFGMNNYLSDNVIDFWMVIISMITSIIILFVYFKIKKYI